MATRVEAERSEVQRFAGVPSESYQAQGFSPVHSADAAAALQQKGWIFLKVSGKSMFPWIREGDIVFLRKAAIADVARGDVVVFARSGLLCVHRVLSLETRSTENQLATVLMAKGDATADRDDAVSADQFRGKVEFIYRRNREIRIAQGWRKYFGKLLAFGSPITSWWRPAASALNRQTACCELLVAPRVELRRSSESSAD